MGLKPAKTGFGAILTVAVAPKGMVFAIGNWAKGMKDSPDKRKKTIRNEKRKFSDFLKKTAKDKKITVKELLKNPIFAGMLKWKRKQWRNTLKALNEKFPDGSTRFSRGVDSGEEKYKRANREYRYPLLGSKKNKGLIPLARMALAGDQGLKKHLKPDADEIITGDPICICPPEKLKEFRKELNHGIWESGTIIIKGGLTGNDINAQTVRLNRLIELYRLPEIEAQVDFIVRELPDPDNPGRTRKLLSLDIQVSKPR